MTSTDNIREQVIAHTATLRDMAARVLADGGEPNCTAEKLSCAFRAAVRALAPLGLSAGQFADEIARESRP